MHDRLRHELLERISARGGFVNAHTHLDIAGVADLAIVDHVGSRLGATGALVGELPLSVKMAVLDGGVRSSDEYERTFEHRISTLLDAFSQDGVRAVRTCVTVSPTLRTASLSRMVELRDAFAGSIAVQVGIMHLGSVMTDKSERDHFQRLAASPEVDFLSGLPQADSSRVSDYLRWLFELAGENEKPLEVHCDEYLSAAEDDTAMMAEECTRARRGGYTQTVASIHSASLAAKSPARREEVACALKEASAAVVVCPRSSISMSSRDELNYMHNCLAPVAELLAADVCIALGTDNIRDMFLPLSDGSLWTELEFLAEAVRLYDLDLLADIASTNGARVLGIKG